MGGDLFCVHSAEVTHTAAGVFAGVAVEHFAPVAAVGNAEAVSQAGHRSEVADDQHGVLRRIAFSQQGNRAGGDVVAIDPFDADGIIVEQVHGGLAPVGPGEVL